MPQSTMRNRRVSEINAHEFANGHGASQANRMERAERRAEAARWQSFETVRRRITAEMPLRDVFAEADTDGSGFLDRKELRGFLRALGLGVYMLDIEQLLVEIDEDGDGVISREELLSFLERGADEEGGADEEEAAQARAARTVKKRNTPSEIARQQELQRQRVKKQVVAYECSLMTPSHRRLFTQLAYRQQLALTGLSFGEEEVFWDFIAHKEASDSVGVARAFLDLPEAHRHLLVAALHDHRDLFKRLAPADVLGASAWAERAKREYGYADQGDNGSRAQHHHQWRAGHRHECLRGLRRALFAAHEHAYVPAAKMVMGFRVCHAGTIQKAAHGHEIPRELGGLEGEGQSKGREADKEKQKTQKTQKTQKKQKRKKYGDGRSISIKSTSDSKSSTNSMSKSKQSSRSKGKNSRSKSNSKSYIAAVGTRTHTRSPVQESVSLPEISVARHSTNESKSESKYKKQEQRQRQRQRQRRRDQPQTTTAVPAVRTGRAKRAATKVETGAGTVGKVETQTESEAVAVSHAEGTGADEQRRWEQEQHHHLRHHHHHHHHHHQHQQHQQQQQQQQQQQGLLMEDAHDQLVTLYLQFNPAKVGDVPWLLEKYASQLPALVESAKVKYGALG